MNAPHPEVFRRVLRRSWVQRARSWYILFFQLPWLPENRILEPSFLPRVFRGLATRKEARRFVGHTANAHTISFAPDGRTALTGGDDRTVRLWDVATGQELRVFLGHTDAVWYVTCTRDGKRALSCGMDRTLLLWDVATAKELKVFEGHTAAVECADLSPDGRHVVSGGQDGTVRLWDADTGSEEQKLVERAPVIFTVAFSKDGSRVLICGGDQMVRLLSARTGAEERRFTGHKNHVTSAAVSTRRTRGPKPTGETKGSFFRASRSVLAKPPSGPTSTVASSNPE